MISKVILFFLSSFYAAAFSQNSCANLFTKNKSSVSQVYENLVKVQNESQIELIAIQSDFDKYIDPSGGGSCASVSAFNLLQGLRVISEKLPLSPKSVLETSYKDIPELKDGRVTNGQMLKLINSFQRKYLLRSRLKISVSSTHLVQSDEPQNQTLINLDSDLLKTNSNEIKMIVYSVTRVDGQILGRHFVILKDIVQLNRISVLDPNNFFRNIEYDLNVGNDAAAIRLTKPGSVSSSVALTIDSIFSIKIME